MQTQSSSVQIRYLNPYPTGEDDKFRFQSFNTLEEAKRMITFYRSCGTYSEIVTW